MHFFLVFLWSYEAHHIGFSRNEKNGNSFVMSLKESISSLFFKFKSSSYQVLKEWENWQFSCYELNRYDECIFSRFFCKAMEFIILDSQWMRKWQFVMNLKDMKLWSSEAPHIDSQGMRKMALWLSDETTNEARTRAARIW